MDLRRWLVVISCVVVPSAFSQAKPSFAILPVTLNNISPLPDTHADSAALGTLTHEARERLVGCGYPLIADTGAPPAGVGHAPSYLFLHPDLVAQWGAAQHADWVLVSRFNRIGPWAAQWEVEIVSTAQQQAIGTSTIDLRGVGRDSGITAHMATRGAAWMVDQALQAVAHASGDTANGGRPCRA
jgi:hypothetical protein